MRVWKATWNNTQIYMIELVVYSELEQSDEIMHLVGKFPHSSGYCFTTGIRDQCFYIDNWDIVSRLKTLGFDVDAYYVPLVIEDDDDYL
jgi:hypothetical protein